MLTVTLFYSNVVLLIPIVVKITTIGKHIDVFCVTRAYSIIGCVFTIHNLRTYMIYEWRVVFS